MLFCQHHFLLIDSEPKALVVMEIQITVNSSFLSRFIQRRYCKRQLTFLSPKEEVFVLLFLVIETLFLISPLIEHMFRSYTESKDLVMFDF